MISLKLPLSRVASRASLGKDDWEDLEHPDSRPASPHKSLTSSSASSVMSAASSYGAEAGALSLLIVHLYLCSRFSLLSSSLLSEDLTINVKKTLEADLGKQHSIEYAKITTTNSLLNANLNLCSDLRLLAISTSMTELSYSISDIQTRIFGKKTRMLVGACHSYLIHARA